MWFHPEVIIKKNSVVSKSGLYEQYQGLDVIIEEVNKALKSLIPPVSQYYHWKIAIWNCKKFIELRDNLFKLISYNDSTLESRIWLEAIMKCQRFCIKLRGHKFINPMNIRTICQSLWEEYELSIHLNNFTYLAKQAWKNYIIDVFINKKPSLFFRLILITKQEADAQENEKNISKAEILLKIETLFEQLGENTQKKYPGLRSKKQGELLDILQEIKHLFTLNNNFNSE